MITSGSNKTGRKRFLFHVEVGAFIVIVSFLYGLSAGLTRKLQTAQASFDGTALETSMRSEEYISPKLSLVEGLTIVPIGNEITINGNVAEAVMFYSNQAVQSLVQGQVSRWRAKGVTAFAQASRNRGVGIGVDSISGEKYSVVAWIVPPTVRNIVANGYAVQGFISVSTRSDVSNSEARSGEVPGVPLIVGGKGGSVISSVERGETTYTGVYTNPGKISENSEFYRGTLAADGWKEVAGNSGNPRFGFLKFTRDGDEVDLLFSALAQGKENTESGEKTVVVVTLHPAEKVSG